MFSVIFITAVLLLMLAVVFLMIVVVLNRAIEENEEQKIMQFVESGELRKYFDDYFEKYLASEEFKARTNRIVHEFLAEEEQKG